MTKDNRTKLLFLVFFHLRTQREKKIDNLQLIFDQSNSASTTYNRRERERERFKAGERMRNACWSGEAARVTISSTDPNRSSVSFASSSSFSSSFCFACFSALRLSA